MDIDSIITYLNNSADPVCHNAAFLLAQQRKLAQTQEFNIEQIRIQLNKATQQLKEQESLQQENEELKNKVCALELTWQHILKKELENPRYRYFVDNKDYQTLWTLLTLPEDVELSDSIPVSLLQSDFVLLADLVFTRNTPDDVKELFNFYSSFIFKQTKVSTTTLDMLRNTLIRRGVITESFQFTKEKKNRLQKLNIDYAVTDITVLKTFLGLQSDG